MRADVLVIGAGPAGASAARALAERGKTVEVWERRPYVGGNTYDRLNEAGVLVHVYGPHIFHTADEGVYAFLSRFTGWYPLEHRVLASVHGLMLPVPFNYDSIDAAFDVQTARRMRAALAKRCGEGGRITIMELLRDPDEDLTALARYVYENVFKVYTQKQWGAPPEALDGAATARVPVRASRDGRYFADPYQGMPDAGYTALFERMLDHERVTVRLSTDAARHLALRGGALYLDGERLSVPVVYTGALDELLDGERLPYRTLDFEFETLAQDSFQRAGVVNYTVDQPYTRITEFKKLTGQTVPGVTTVAREYPRAYDHARGDIPYYPIPDARSAALYAAQRAQAASCANLHLLGRLAEYKYYNIDAIVRRALDVAAALTR